MDTRTVQREVYVDWLRVLGVLAVFVYHTARLFNPGDWHVKNPIAYGWLDAWDAFATTWLMPLLFVVSGISLYFAVGKSGTVKFLRDKVLWLVVPLLAGMFTHVSLQVYLERLTHGDFSGTYFQGHYEGAIPRLLTWGIIFAISLTVTMGFYELLVGRFNVLRVPFGLKWRPEAQTAQLKPAEPAAG